MENRFCPECGHQVSVTAKFCQQCGQRLKTIPQSGGSPKVMGVNSANRWAQVFTKLGLPPVTNRTRNIVNQALDEDHPRLGENETVICGFPVKAPSSSGVMRFLKESLVSKRDITVDIVVADNAAGEQLFFLDDGFFIVTSNRLIFSPSDGIWGKFASTDNLVAAEVEESTKQVFLLALRLENGTTLRCLFDLPHASLGTTLALFHEDSVVQESTKHQLRQSEAMANDARSVILAFFNELVAGAM